MSRPSILIIEDDRELAVMISDYLGEQGFAASVESRGDRAVARILAEKPDILVLDLMLPGKDGLSVCREVRASYRGPILMLTARGGEVDEVVGLEVGADDYLPKPVRPRVLLARLRALLRRTGEAKGERISVGELAIDPGRRAASWRGKDLDLTSGELDLLALLASHAGRIVTRRELYNQLRGVEPDELDRSIDLMVSRLRHKLREASGDGDAIKTVRGVGYLYAAS